MTTSTESKSLSMHLICILTSSMYYLIMCLLNRQLIPIDHIEMIQDVNFAVSIITSRDDGEGLLSSSLQGPPPCSPTRR